jgi:hypothetical protein
LEEEVRELVGGRVPEKVPWEDEKGDGVEKEL